jgi:hypothetical protein
MICLIVELDEDESHELTHPHVCQNRPGPLARLTANDGNDRSAG